MGHLGASGFFPYEPRCTSRTAAFLRLCVAGVLVLAAAGCKSSSSTATGTVALDATTSNPTYASAEPVVASIVVTNGTGASVGFSPNVSGTLSIVSLTKDGVAVATRETVSKNDEDLSAILRQSLRSVDTGQSLTVTWASEYDAVLQGQCLRTVEYNSSAGNRAVYYLVGLPGQYVLKAQYALPAAAARSGETVQNPAGPVTVTFAVSP
jgi:hypothetical protein